MTRNDLLRRLLVVVLVAVALPAAAQDRDWLVSYEAMPPASVALPGLAHAPYNERHAATQATAALVPEIAAALGLGGDRIRTEITLGGDRLGARPVLRSRITGPSDLADRFAAAVGFVSRQDGVFVFDLADPEGGTLMVQVTAPGAITPELAHGFFRHAATMEPGLGGGYAVIGRDIVFFNLRSGTGQPLSRLSDPEFLHALERAVASFRSGALRITTWRHVRVRSVENDWNVAPDGRTYLAYFADTRVLRALRTLRERHTAIVAEQARRFGWR